MMVLAGPGSGKTSVIVERTAYMTGEGKIPGSSVLVVTIFQVCCQRNEGALPEIYKTGLYGCDLRNLPRRVFTAF